MKVITDKNTKYLIWVLAIFVMLDTYITFTYWHLETNQILLYIGKDIGAIIKVLLGIIAIIIFEINLHYCPKDKTIFGLLVSINVFYIVFIILNIWVIL